MMNAEERWGACPRGELSRLGTRLRWRRRRRTALKAGSLLSVLLVCVVGFWSISTGPPDHTFAGITCTRVISLATNYEEDTLEPERRAQVRSHVDQCPSCHERFESMGLLSQLLPLSWLRVESLAMDGGLGSGENHLHGRSPS